MTGPWHIRVYEKQVPVCAVDLEGPVELGRQDRGENKPYYHYKKTDRYRLVMARQEEDTVSRRHVLIEPAEPDRARVTNLSEKLSIRLLPDDRELRPGQSEVMPLPVMLTVGRRTVRVHTEGTPPLQLVVLPESVAAAGPSIAGPSALPSLANSIQSVPNQREFLQSLKALASVLNNCATSSSFFEPAAEAMVQMIELDSGRVLLLENGEWQVKAAYFRDAIVPDPQWRPSTQILACLQQMKRGLYQVPSSAAETVSLAGIKSVAAAPILDRNGNVVGAIYGDRRLDGGTQVVRPISALEATLVELLAQAVATGLARIEEESKRLQLEQFFTRELATQLTTRRELLAGQDAEVTVLFCDVRGFSRISANLGGAKTVAWINDLMSELSECVLAHQGVLVDYIGDALMAMWGAPDDRADHAQLACLAALEMLSSTPRLNARWRDALGEPLQLSIGLNTGIARVGNIGSQRKFKYGPLGETVNIASRVQGATRYLKSALLLTRSTFEKLTDSSPARRVATVRLVNIDQPVELFELPDPNLQPPPEWKPAYESALNDFEKHRFRQATAAFRPLVDGEFEDETALVLLARAVNALVSGPEPQHPIWELPGK